MLPRAAAHICSASLRPRRSRILDETRWEFARVKNLPIWVLQHWVRLEYESRSSGGGAGGAQCGGRMGCSSTHSSGSGLARVNATECRWCVWMN